MFTLSTSSISRSSSCSLALATIIAAAACNSSDVNYPTLVATGLAVRAVVDSQTVAAGQPTPNIVSVEVLAQNGAGMPGATVTWTVVGGGGAVSTASSITDSTGVATTTWTVGTVAGVNTLQAALPGGAMATVTAIGVAGPPAVLNIVSGNNQTVTVDSTTAPFVVSVADQYGNMIHGLNISWASTAGALSAALDATDATGEASDVLTTDESTQNYSVTAMVGSLFAVFSVTAN